MEITPISSRQIILILILVFFIAISYCSIADAIPEITQSNIKESTFQTNHLTSDKDSKGESGYNTIQDYISNFFGSGEKIVGKSRLNDLKTKTLVDAGGRLVTIPEDPHRIITLTPDGTHLLIAMGEEERIIGTGNKIKDEILLKRSPDLLFCPVLGFPDKEMDYFSVTSLYPEIILVSSRYRSYADCIQRKTHIPVVLTQGDLSSVEQFLQSVRVVGEVVHKPSQVERIEEIYKKFDQIVEEKPVSEE